MDEFYGPPLPPDYQQSSSPPLNNKNDCTTGAKTIPPNANDTSDSSYPSSSRTPDTQLIGPTLPSGFKLDLTESDESKKNQEQGIIGPVLPSGFNTSNDSDALIGPQPYTGDEISHSHLAALDVNLRAKKMKDKLLGKTEHEQAKREIWMLELPSPGKTLGFKARKFSLKPVPQSADCSGWMDTPSDKARKEKGQSTSKESSKPTAAEICDAKKNTKLSDIVETYNKANRTESLIKMYQNSRKRKAEEENKPEENKPEENKPEENKSEERRAFDRETDLLLSSLDEDKKKLIIKRSEELNSRFAHGQSSHFL